MLYKYNGLEKDLGVKMNHTNDELIKVTTELNQITSHQNNISDFLIKTSDECRKLRTEISEFESSKLAIKAMEMQVKREQIEDLKSEIMKKEQSHKDRLNEEIHEVQEKMKGRQNEMESIETQIEKIESSIKETEGLKDNTDNQTQEKRSFIKEVADQIRSYENMIRNEKISYDQNVTAEKKLEKEKKDQLEEIEKGENELAMIQKSKKDREVKLEELKKYVEGELTVEEQKWKREYDDYERKRIDADNKLGDNISKKFRLAEDDKMKQRKVSSKKDQLEIIKKKVDSSLTELKKTENNTGKAKHDLEAEINSLKDIKIKKTNLLKDLSDVVSIIKKISRDSDKIVQDKNDKDELRKIELNHLNLEEEEKNKLKERKDKLLKKVEQIKKNIVSMKNLRETIIRTVSRLEESTRFINDEIQIKELAYLDLTKRHEELKVLYQKYHKFYETVLAERNKNVSKIHKANQRKAEYKEKMTLLTSDMDILEADLNKTNNILFEKNKDLADIKQQQTTIKQEINKKQYEYKENEEEVKKLTNENEKLHTMLSVLESEMVNMRVDYELACESRNFTGIQLIDRNDELCIFYEKVQHLENQINEINKVIMSKENHIRSLVLNNKEIERFIEVNRKKMPQIPDLTNKISELENEIKILSVTLEKLVAKIEDPTDSFKRELPGEDPDIDYLRMKYDQLAYMLNSKKEILLEKELINEEINDIAEKLKQRALVDRDHNLEINEKINEFEMKLTEITRKVIASTSELSIFKAMLMNLQQTKDEKEKMLEQAEEKLKNGEPPLQECEKEWDSMIQLEAHRSEYFERRMKIVNEKRSLSVEIPLRKKPEERPHQYQDNRGFHCVYGKHGQFKNYPNPSNMKYFKGMRLNKLPETNKREGEYNHLLI